MKKLVFSLLAGAMMLAGTSAMAQDSKGFRFGIGIEAGLPLGGLKTSYNLGAGLTLRGSYGVADKIDVTLTSGAIAFIPKDLTVAGATIDTKAAVWIPIKVGGRYMISDNFYVMGEAGATIAKTYAVTGFSGSTFTYGFVNSTEFTYAPSVGVKFGGIDIGVRYEGVGSASFMGARLGFTF